MCRALEVVIPAPLVEHPSCATWLTLHPAMHCISVQELNVVGTAARRSRLDAYHSWSPPSSCTLPSLQTGRLPSLSRSASDGRSNHEVVDEGFEGAYDAPFRIRLSDWPSLDLVPSDCVAGDCANTLPLRLVSIDERRMKQRATCVCLAQSDRGATISAHSIRFPKRTLHAGRYLSQRPRPLLYLNLGALRGTGRWMIRRHRKSPSAIQSSLR